MDTVATTGATTSASSCTEAANNALNTKPMVSCTRSSFCLRSNIFFCLLSNCLRDLSLIERDPHCNTVVVLLFRICYCSMSNKILLSTNYALLLAVFNVLLSLIAGLMLQGKPHYQRAKELHQLRLSQQDFNSWATEKGIRHQVEILCNADNVRGIYSASDVHEGDIVLEIPIGLCFIGSDDGTIKPSDCLWPIQIAQQLLKEADSKGKGSFGPYLNILPQQFAFPSTPEMLPFLPVHWDTVAFPQPVLEAVNNINSDIMPMIQSLNDWRKWAYSQVSSEEKRDSRLDYYIDIVQTRGCRLYLQSLEEGKDDNSKFNALVPFYDMINHASEAEVNTFYYFDQEKEAIVLLAKRDIAKGQEVFITYGPLQPHECLVNYGFVPFVKSETDFLSVNIPVASLIDSNYVQERMSSSSVDNLPEVVQLDDTLPVTLLHRLGIPPNADSVSSMNIGETSGYEVYRNGLGMSFLIAARIIAMTPEQRKSLSDELYSLDNPYSASIFKKTVSRENEQNAIDWIIAVIEEKIAKQKNGSKILSSIQSKLEQDTLEIVKMLLFLAKFNMQIYEENLIWLHQYRSKLI